MGAFNELYHTFETVAAINDPIYNDSADAGYSYHTDHVPLDIKMLFDEINEMKEHASEMIVDRTRYHSGVEIIIHVPIEIDNNTIVGYKYIVNFCKTKKHPSLINKEHNAFVNVIVKRYTTFK